MAHFWDEPKLKEKGENEKQHQIQKPLPPLNKKLEIFVRSFEA
jgi:hypothetical protein